MDTVELLAKFADPEVMKTLPLMERVIAGLITTVLGMGITFISLVVLQFVIGLMAKLTSEKVKETKGEDVGSVVGQEATEKASLLQDEEIVAVITTSLAIQLRTSVSNIVIRNIERVEESSTAWHRAGIAEHMNNRM